MAVAAAKLRRTDRAQLAGIYTAGQRGCHLDTGMAAVTGPFGFEGAPVGDAVAGADGLLVAQSGGADARPGGHMPAEPACADGAKGVRNREPRNRERCSGRPATSRSS